MLEWKILSIDQKLLRLSNFITTRFCGCLCGIFETISLESFIKCVSWILLMIGYLNLCPCQWFLFQLWCCYLPLTHSTCHESCTQLLFHFVLVRFAGEFGLFMNINFQGPSTGTVTKTWLTSPSKVIVKDMIKMVSTKQQQKKEQRQWMYFTHLYHRTRTFCFVYFLSVDLQGDK